MTRIPFLPGSWTLRYALVFPKILRSLVVLLLLSPHWVWGETAPRRVKVRQGDVIPLTLPGMEGPDAVVGQFQNQTIPFFETLRATSSNAAPSASRFFTALLGIDMEHPPGEYPFEMTVQEKSSARPVPYTIEVLPADFELQTLTLPKDKVDLDAPTLARVEREAAQFRDILSRPSRSQLWQAPFLEPVTGEISGRFGLRRVINGEKKAPHTGVDIAAPMGEKVIAPNTGHVVLTGDFFFNGQSVVLDHGGGVVTMYFHLSEIAVKEGMLIKKGDILGRVGASGRATGPHLHWGTRLHGARVDPFLLIKALAPSDRP